ncbi:MAG: PaaI family thioesterase [Candidatus Eisenbacteria bacterium]|nr:PaaI family thioesterase [Candidatus Eisenbacteria bacterium]
MNRFTDNDYCFACGSRNPIGLHLNVRTDEEGSAVFTWTPKREYQGWSGVLHGGVISTLLDEAMAYATGSLAEGAATAEIHVSFKKPVSTERALTVTARVEERKRRLMRTSAILVQDGEERAAARAVFVLTAARRSSE